MSVGGGMIILLFSCHGEVAYVCALQCVVDKL